MTTWYFYSIICEFVGLFLFLYGFFWMNYDGGKTSASGSSPIISSQLLTHSYVKKVVFIVIDALRYDFISEEESLRNMPFLHSSVVNEAACVFPCRVHLPTVTMPRIKAITTGSISNFMDIALNFGSSQIKHDNILAQMKSHGLKVVFYGDDTWIRLFPNSFYRSEGTTSFFVSDFYEVDNNVTRNVEKEISGNDWDVMILHYLGLDHIGHVEGPKSSKMPLKLREMDFVIEKIHNYLFRWKETTNSSYLLVVCADHGMRDAGGHGGSSLPEILVPLVTFGLNCSTSGEISQLDIAVTLSMLLGLPIPYESVGKVVPGLLSELPTSLKLNIYQRNVEHLMEKYEQIVGPLSSAKQSVKELLENTQKLSKEDSEQAYQTYVLLSDYLSSSLVVSLTKFDVLYLYIAALIVLQSSCLPLVNCSLKIANLISTLLLAGIIFITLCLVECQSALCSLSEDGAFMAYGMVLTISFNSIHLAASWRVMVEKLKISVKSLKYDLVLTFLVISSILHTLSVVSTSFIEEEHMIWYFLWTSWLVLLLCRKCTKKLATLLIGLLVLHRMLQCLNQTGDKYSSLPDVSDWLVMSEKKMYLSVFLLFGLSWTYCAMWLTSARNKIRGEDESFIHWFTSLDKYSDSLCLTLVYLYRAALGDVFFFNMFFQSSSGVAEFRIYLYALLTSFLLKSTKAIFLHRVLSVSVTRGFVEMWILASAILMRPYNVVLLGSLLMTSDWLSKIIRVESNHVIKIVLAHHWLAQVYFFYQGNSNNLATIDITAGYAGQTEYNAVIIGGLIIVSTYAMPVLAYALLLKEVFLLLYQRAGKRCNVDVAGETLLALNNFHVAFYLIIIIVQRHHLFIWSVFSPKLLYLSAYCLMLYPFIAILLIGTCYVKR